MSSDDQMKLEAAKRFLGMMQEKAAKAPPDQKPQMNNLVRSGKALVTLSEKAVAHAQGQAELNPPLDQTNGLLP